MSNKNNIDQKISDTKNNRKSTKGRSKSDSFQFSRTTILSRDDLSFTKRDSNGLMINWVVQPHWFMPPRNGNWHEHYGIGEFWFQEIVELARNNPEEAFNALRFIVTDLARDPGSRVGGGHAEGFITGMARWAIAAILANERVPKLPFETLDYGVPPREGMDFHLARAQFAALFHPKADEAQ